MTPRCWRLLLPQGFQPPASIIEYLEEHSDVRVRVQTNSFFTADHVKTIVVDHEVGFVGGMNIVREYRYGQLTPGDRSGAA